MEEYVSTAWVQLISQRENLLPGWEKDIAQGNALERLRAAQMKELTEKYPAWFQAAKNTPQESPSPTILSWLIRFSGDGSCS